jgi:hypothetical protein
LVLLLLAFDGSGLDGIVDLVVVGAGDAAVVSNRLLLMS